MTENQKIYNKNVPLCLAAEILLKDGGADFSLENLHQ